MQIQYFKPYKTLAHIHSLNGSLQEVEIIGIIEDNTSSQTTYIAEYNNIRCTAIYNCFASAYYVDDKYGIIKD